MSLKALLCIPLGHRWTAKSDTFDAEPLLHCSRCGRTRDVGAETRDRSRNPGNVGPLPPGR